MFKKIRKKTGRILMHAAEKLMTGRYEGAAAGRRLGVGSAPLSGPNLTLDGSIQTLRARSRDHSRQDKRFILVMHEKNNREINQVHTPTAIPMKTACSFFSLADGFFCLTHKNLA